MKIISYEAHNVLGVKDIRFDMEGRHLFLVGGKNGQGKCLPEGTPVALWDGTTIPIEQVRDSHDVVGYDYETNRFSRQRILGLHYNGQKDCYRLRTKSGHEVIATGNHRLVCDNGWRELRDFVPGDAIAVPIRLPCSPESTNEECQEAMLAGLLLGDGCLGRTIDFTVADKGVKSIFINAARSVFPDYDPSIVVVNKVSGLEQISVRTRNGSRQEGTPTYWLNSLGLRGCDSFTKFVPDVFFARGKETLRYLVAGLFAKTDGYIIEDQLAQFAVRSEQLARGCWRALLRIGVPAELKVGEKVGKPVYFVNVNRFGWEDFASTVLPLIPRSRIRSRTQRVDGSPRAGNRKDRGTGKGRTYLVPANAVKMLHAAGGAGVYSWASRGRSMGVDIFSEKLQKLTAPCQELVRHESMDVCFSTVVSIEPVGARQTFDLEMPTGAFVANDFVVHNSSALNALVMTLCGKSGMGTKDYPAIALRDGQKKGKVTVELTGSTDLHEDTGLTAELSLRRKASGVVVEEFRLLDSTGAEAPEPRKTLQRLFQLKAFDPLEFERMKPKEKASCVQQMLGLDLSKYDKEHKSVFEERTAVGRDGKKLAAQLEAMEKHKDVPSEEVKVVDLMEEVDKLKEENKIRDAMAKLAEDLKKSQVELTSEADALVEKIAVLQKQLKETKSKIEAAEKAEAEARKKLGKLPDRTEDIAAVKEKIAQADETNRKVRENQSYDKLAAELKESRGQWQKLTDRLNEIAEERAEEVAGADWPIEGMELQEDGLVWNGLPFEQASTSQRIMASVAVGMRLNPELRLLVCEHGSDLDLDTLNALDEVLKQHDFQMLCEVVCRSKEDEERCAVVIADGEVVGAEKADDDDTEE